MTLETREPRSLRLRMVLNDCSVRTQIHYPNPDGGEWRRVSIEEWPVSGYDWPQSSYLAVRRLQAADVSPSVREIAGSSGYAIVLDSRDLDAQAALECAEVDVECALTAADVGIRGPDGILLGEYVREDGVKWISDTRRDVIRFWTVDGTPIAAFGSAMPL